MKKQITMIMVVMAGLILMAATIVFALEKSDSNGNPAGPEAETSLHWKTGEIDSISLKKVVINDSGYRLTNDTSFRDSDGTIMDLSDFSKGMQVTFTLDRGCRTIVRLVKGKVRQQ